MNGAKAMGVLLSSLLLCGCSRQPPEGMAFSGETAVEPDRVRLLVDDTWTDANGERHVRQEIFDSMFRMIDEAQEFILIDLFLVNGFGYQPGPCMRPLHEKLADRLIAKKKAVPGIRIVFVSDPINTLYGSLDAQEFKRMEAAGIRVVWTDLDRLRDSNPLFSKPWRLLVRPWGTGPGNAVANPMGEGRVSLRSFLKLLNFKANHRKIVLTERSLLVGSANPHGGSSAHRNTALRVDGAALRLAWDSESAILRLSGAGDIPPPDFRETPAASGNRLRLLTERRIKEAALELLRQAPPGGRIDLAMFYFADGDLVDAFIAAKARGCDVRVILDPNKDAFGRVKNGVPNRQTAARLVAAGIPMRWADTHGEQAHTKMLYAARADSTTALLLGSANYTRRNLDNFNGECDLEWFADPGDDCMRRAREEFDAWWGNTEGRTFTVDYDHYADRSRWRMLQARFMEATGLCTF